MSLLFIVESFQVKMFKVKVLQKSKINAEDDRAKGVASRQQAGILGNSLGLSVNYSPKTYRTVHYWSYPSTLVVEADQSTSEH